MKLRYTKPALADLELILDYVSEKSPQGGEKIKARIKAVTELLGHFPKSGTLTSDGLLRRKIVLPYPYVIFYETVGDEVVIHAVRHGARDPGSMP